MTTDQTLESNNRLMIKTAVSELTLKPTWECPEHVAISTNFVECNFIEDRKSDKTTLNFKNSQLEKRQEDKVNLKTNLLQVSMSPWNVVLRSLYLHKNVFWTIDFFRSNLSLHFYNSILIFISIKSEALPCEITISHSPGTDWNSFPRVV